MGHVAHREPQDHFTLPGGVTEMGSVLKTVPNVVWICVTVVFLGILTSFVVLSVNGADATEFSRFLNSVMNLGGLILGGIGAVGGTAAAVNAKQAADQTKGPITDLQEKVETLSAHIQHNGKE